MDIEGLRRAADDAGGNMNRAVEFLTESSHDVYPSSAGNFQQAGDGVRAEMTGLMQVRPAADETADRLLQRTGEVNDLLDGLPSEEVSHIIQSVSEASSDCRVIISDCLEPLKLVTAHRDIADDLLFVAAALAISPDVKAGSRARLDTARQELEDYREGL